MKVEDVIVAVERRSLGGCIDLAFVFVRTFAGPMIQLLLLFAVPSCTVVWLLTSATTDMLIPSILIFMFFATLYSGTLIAAIGPQVFGVPMSSRQALRSVRERLLSFLVMSALYRLLQVITGFCMVLPSLLVTAQMGHLAEVMLLEKTPFTQVARRLTWLGKGGGFTRNLTRAGGLMAFWAVFSLGLFMMIDILASALFHMPIFLGRLPRMNLDFDDNLMAMALDSPLFLTTLQAAIWLPYPIVRLAWFFCYLDQRIRNECWDIELQFRIESHRLEELA